jgi:hypothetical protein
VLNRRFAFEFNDVEDVILCSSFDIPALANSDVFNKPTAPVHQLSLDFYLAGVLGHSRDPKCSFEYIVPKQLDVNKLVDKYLFLFLPENSSFFSWNYPRLGKRESGSAWDDFEIVFWNQVDTCVHTFVQVELEMLVDQVVFYEQVTQLRELNEYYFPEQVFKSLIGNEVSSDCKLNYT